MSFETLAALDGKGVWWGVEVSFDNFATIAYRWATHSGIVEANLYERRLTKLGDITRGLGVDGLPAASNLDLYLDNTDFALDWLADATVFTSQTVRAKFRLRLGFWDPTLINGITVTAPVVVTKALGVFSALDQPELTAAEVKLTLADDFINGLNDLLRPPTINDWMNASDSSQCPFIGLTGFANNNRPSTTYGGSASQTGFIKVDVDFNQPWPLMWGVGNDGYVVGQMIAPGQNVMVVTTATLTVLSNGGIPNGVRYDGVVAGVVVGQIANLVSVTYNNPAGPTTTVAVTTIKDPDGNVQDQQIVVSPKAGETNAGVAIAVNASGPAAALVTATAVGTTTDVVVARAHAFLTGGFGFPNAWVHPDGFTAGTVNGEKGFWRQILVCATADTSNVNANDVVALEVVFKDKLATATDYAGKTYRIPQTANGLTVWQANKTQSLSVGGYNWKLLWIEISLANYAQTFPVSPPPMTDAINQAANYSSPIMNVMADAFDHFNVYTQGALSAVNGVANVAQNPVDVLQDMVQYYSNQRGYPGGPVDTASFDRARKARHSLSAVGQIQVQYSTSVASGAKFSFVNGSVNQTPGKASKLGYNTGLLRQAIGELCRSFDLDLFVRFDGKCGCSARVADFTAVTATYPSVDETRIVQSSVKKRTPSPDERWAYFNSAYFSVPGGTGAGELGPFRNETAVTAAGGKVVEKHLGGSWWPYPQAVVATASLWSVWGTQLSFAEVENILWAARGLESKGRPVVEFDTDFTFFATDIDLGGDFLFTWTRGGRSVQYTNALFRCESMVIHPMSGSITLGQVWIDDLRQPTMYLLDDETFLTRVSSGGGRTATVADGSTTVTFSSGSLITDGVQPGDHLILKDATEGATSFKRNRALKIASVTDATHLVVTGNNTFTDFGGGAAVVAWEIRRSEATYPTSGSDPTHYPSGGAMYGKVSDIAGLYGDGSTGNQLLDG